MFKALSAALYLRRISRDLTAISAALDRQTALLARVVDRYAPADPPTDRAEVRHDTGVSHLDTTDAALAMAYVHRTERDTGHSPDDEEILTYLADEKTTSLHKRLLERDAEIERLSSWRR